MKFRKINRLTILLIAMVFALFGCNKPTDNQNRKKVLTVGTPGLSGDFISGFGNSSYDVYVRNLIDGYSTLVETENGEFVWDTVAVLEKEPTIRTTEDGHKAYRFKLQDDLRWSDGTFISAKDYVGHMLLKSSPDWASIATTANVGYYLLNFEEYRYGKLVTDPNDSTKQIRDPNYKTALDVSFDGVHLYNDLEFEFIIDKKNLPYFYETIMVGISPIPMKVYLPDFDISSNENGAKITLREDKMNTIVHTIETTIQTPQTGQRYKPTVTSGPYQLISFERDIATLRINPNYKTNYEGKKPKIDEIQIKKVNQLTDVEQVIAGTLDLVTGIVEGAKIESAKESPKVGLVSYPRNGYGMLSMATDFGPTRFQAVRQAIGYLFDRNEFLTQILGGYGSIVNGPYGEAQWFYQDKKEELKEKLTNYVLNPEKANQLLDTSPYKYEMDGVTLFDPAKASSTNAYYRYNEDKEVLQINHLGTNENEVTTLIGVQLKAHAWKAGIKYTTTESDFDTLLANYYYGSTQTNRKYHIFNLATGFYSDYDPYWSWHSSLAGTVNNPTNLADLELDRIMEDMQQLEPNQTEEFSDLFVAFVTRWNQLLPNLPLYSNEYFDIYNKRVTGLKSTPVWDWSKDICDLDIK